MKRYVAGLLAGILLMSGVTAYGADAARAIEAYFGRVSIVVDGIPLEDETLLYEGVTYVPIAAVAKALGKEVSYDEATRTGYIGEGAALGQTPVTTPAPVRSGVATFGSTVLFDDLEITFGNAAEWVTLDNQFHDRNGSDVIKIPVSVKNVSDEAHSLNMFYIKKFNPDGIESDDVSYYFDKDDIVHAGEMRSGASQEKYIHMLYDGDGEYIISFATFLGDPVEVYLPIVKP